MLNATILLIFSKIKQLQLIPKDLLNAQIKQDAFSSPFITLIKLITLVDISSYNFNKIKSYLQSLLNIIDIPKKEYNHMLLILLIKAIKNDFQYAQEIYDLYTSLITIPNDSTYHTWLNYMLDTNILPYLIYLHIEHDELSDRIINYPAEIVNYA